MCLIIVQPIGDAPLAGALLQRAWNVNPDGAGYMFSDAGTLVIRKPFYSISKLLASYRTDFAAHGGEMPFVMHLRLASHGDRGPANVHPHLLDHGRAGLVHNGILAVSGECCDESDTAVWCRTILAMRSARQLVSPQFGRLLQSMVGRNKIVLMDGRGKVSIVNEGLGLWEGGRWFSGTSFRKPAVLEFRRWTRPVARGTQFDDEQSGGPETPKTVPWGEPDAPVSPPTDPQIIGESGQVGAFERL